MAHFENESFTGFRKKTMNCIRINRYLFLLILICSITSFILCLNELPTGSDIPAHLIKIINMQKMLEKGNFVRWSYDWYCGYAMFSTYPPLIYMLAATVNLVINNVALVMKLFTIISFSIFPILLYRLGRVLGRSHRGATSMAFLFSLTPLNIFFLFNGYFVFLFSLVLLSVFLTEFFKYIQNRNNTGFVASTAMLTIISITYHRTLYFTLFIIFFYFLIKIYKRQIKEAVSTVAMVLIGVGISSFWLLPAIKDMLALTSGELYQSLILTASYEGINFHLISILFIVPFWYLVLKRLRKERLKNETELVLFLCLIFFSILSIGPYGPLYYVIPFSSSLRIEVTLLFSIFFAITLASSLFDDDIVDGKRTFTGILLSSIIFLTIIIGVFMYPKMALSLTALNFTYSTKEISDSLLNLIRNAYVDQQVFLGKNDEEFLKVLQYISNDDMDGRIAFYSNRSQSVDMFYYYAMLPIFGKSTPQGIAPEGEGDLKWASFTQHIIWNVNETLLRLSGTRWIISNYPLVLKSNHVYKVFGQYWLYTLDDVNMINGCEGTIKKDVGEIRISLSQECRSITLAESYHSRLRAFDQFGKELDIKVTKYGFLNISSTDKMREISLIYSETKIDALGKAISIICLILFTVFSIKKFIPKLNGYNS